MLKSIPGLKLGPKNSFTVKHHTFKLRLFANKLQNACIRVTAYTFNISTRVT